MIIGVFFFLMAERAIRRYTFPINAAEHKRGCCCTWYSFYSVARLTSATKTNVCVPRQHCFAGHYLVGRPRAKGQKPPFPPQSVAHAELFIYPAALLLVCSGHCSARQTSRRSLIAMHNHWTPDSVLLCIISTLKAQFSMGNANLHTHTSKWSPFNW